MSQNEADALIQYGKHWLGNVWVRGDAAERNLLLTHMNEDFNRGGLNIRVSRGFQPTDPVVRVNNRPDTYASLVGWATGQADGGVAAAQMFQQWYSGDNVTLGMLPIPLMAFAVITHFAEVGRGYEAALSLKLYRWIEAIAAAPNAATARDLWRTYRDSFPPSLKYDEDARKEYAE